MTDGQEHAPAGPLPSGGLAAADSPQAGLDDIERALQHQMGPFLKQVKQMTLEAIDEISQKHGSPLLAQLRQTLIETVGVMLKMEVTALLEQMKPAVREGGDAVRKNAAGLTEDLKQFITKTVVEVFQLHVPEYSRRAGQRAIDYFLSGTLFCLAAVLLCLGSILGLEEAGLAPFAAYLIGGGAALAAGFAFLKLRSRRKPGEGPADGTGKLSSW